MSKSTVEKAIKKGAGELEGEHYEEIVYEGYGPGGVAVMVECTTDNRNRTVSEVRHAFTKCGGNLGTDGSVSYMFNKKGIINFPAKSNEDKIMEVALESGADDIVSNDDGSIDVMTNMENFILVKEALDAAGLKAQQAELTMIASVEVSLDSDAAEKMVRLLDMLEELDDVQEVYSNADISDEIMAKLG